MEPMRKVVTDELRQRMIEAAQAKMTNAEIASKVCGDEIDHRYVGRILVRARKEGVDIPRRQPLRPQVTRANRMGAT